MKHFTRIVVLFAVCASMSLMLGRTVYALGFDWLPISKPRSVSIDELIKLSSRKDVESIATYDKEDDIYYVSFLNTRFSIRFSLDKNESITTWTLSYNFPGQDAVETVEELLSYQPSAEELNAAQSLMNDILIYMTERFGSPDVWESPVDTITYTWIVDNWEIDITDSSMNKDLRIIDVIDIRADKQN